MAKEDILSYYLSQQEGETFWIGRFIATYFAVCWGIELNMEYFKVNGDGKNTSEAVNRVLHKHKRPNITFIELSSFEDKHLEEFQKLRANGVLGNTPIVVVTSAQNVKDQSLIDAVGIIDVLDFSNVRNRNELEIRAAQETTRLVSKIAQTAA